MQIMAQYSPMHDEAALLGMLRSLQGGSSGTAIWCYNMRTPTEFSTEVRRVFKICLSLFSPAGKAGAASRSLNYHRPRKGWDDLKPDLQMLSWNRSVWFHRFSS